MEQILGVILGALIIYFSFAIKWVQKPFRWIVERNFPGTRTKVIVWDDGFHFLPIPFYPVYYVRTKVNTAQKPITIHLGMKDGLGRPDPVDFQDARAGVLVQVIYEVVDPQKATYQVQEGDLTVQTTDEAGVVVPVTFKGYERATVNRLEADLRSFFGKYDFDDANKDAEKTRVETDVLAKSGPFIEAEWGVKIHSIDIIDFILDEETAKLRQGRLAAKTEADAAAAKAEGEKKATITIAEGKRAAAHLAGQGELDRLKEIMGVGLRADQAAAYVLAQGNIQALGETKATVFATSEGGNISQLAGMAMAKLISGSSSAPTTPTTPTSTPAPTPTPTPAPTAPPSGPPGSSGTALSPRRRGNP